MRKSHKGHQNSLTASIAAGAALLALVLSPVSAAYLFQASVIGPDFGRPPMGDSTGGSGSSFGGPMDGRSGFGGPMGGQMGGPNFKSEIAKAEKAVKLFAAVTYDPTSCQLISDSSAKYDKARSDLADASDSLDLLDPETDAREIKDLRAQIVTLKKDLNTAKKDKSKAASACKKELKKVEKVQRVLGGLPLDEIDGAMELMADMQACSALIRPQPMGNFNGPQMGRPMDGGMDNGNSDQPEGDCSDIATSLRTTTASLPVFIQDRKDSLAEEEDMKNQFKQQDQETTSMPGQDSSTHDITNPQTRTGITNPQTRTGSDNKQQRPPMDQQRPPMDQQRPPMDQQRPPMDQEQVNRPQ